MKKTVIISWCLIFILFFIAPQVVYGIRNQGDAVNTENRVLAEMPELSLATIETFPNEFEVYYNDTLPFRSKIISANSYMNYALFQESAVQKVIIGDDNWLFYNPNGLDGDVIGDLKGETVLSEQELYAMMQNLTQVKNIIESQGKEFVICIVPNKESLYGNKYLPTYYQSQAEQTTADIVVEYLQTNSDLRVVYPKDELLEAMAEFPEYDFCYNTDTHWNYLGSYVGARSLMQELGHEMPALTEDNIKYQGQYSYGLDLANMMSMSPYIHEENAYYVDYIPKGQIISSEKDFSTEFRFETDIEDGEKIFIVRDSFCTAMAEYIASNYSDAVMIHESYYNPEMIEVENPDVIVFQCCERYIPRLLTLTVTP